MNHIPNRIATSVYPYRDIKPCKSATVPVRTIEIARIRVEFHRKGRNSVDISAIYIPGLFAGNQAIGPEFLEIIHFSN
jgi:hypothetical protein